MIPQELEDKVFLYLDFETLENTRIIQSYYAKKTTKFKDINDATLNNNLDNMKWLRNNDCPWSRGTLEKLLKMVT
jgi:hypothetical protein